MQPQYRSRHTLSIAPLARQHTLGQHRSHHALGQYRRSPSAGIGRYRLRQYRASRRQVCPSPREVVCKVGVQALDAQLRLLLRAKVANSHKKSQKVTKSHKRATKRQEKEYTPFSFEAVSYTHLRAHETEADL
eukprot:3893410-Rhodomonas_salina.3